jgi:hypothetical protein
MAWGASCRYYTQPMGRAGPVGLVPSGAWPGTARNKNGSCRVGQPGLRRSPSTTRSPLSGSCWAGGPMGPTVPGRPEAQINFHIFTFFINFVFLIKNYLISLNLN